jgi:hypothetical protein
MWWKRKNRFDFRFGDLRFLIWDWKIRIEDFFPNHVRLSVRAVTLSAVEGRERALFSTAKNVENFARNFDLRSIKEPRRYGEHRDAQRLWFVVIAAGLVNGQSQLNIEPITTNKKLNRLASLSR